MSNIEGGNLVQLPPGYLPLILYGKLTNVRLRTMRLRRTTCALRTTVAHPGGGGAEVWRAKFVKLLNDLGQNDLKKSLTLDVKYGIINHGKYT